MGETETERLIDNKTDRIIKILFRNDYKGLLLMDMEEYDDTAFVQKLPPKASPAIMKQELMNVMGLITEIRGLAKNLNNLDVRDEVNEGMDELEKDRRNVYDSIETEDEEINVQNTQFPVEVITITRGGISNVSDWA